MQSNIETRVGIFVLLALCAFVYMGFQIDAFRFTSNKYVSYRMNFKNIAGLSRKGNVKIAGVKVGWVEHITLSPDDATCAQADVMILKDCHLYHDACALVRQEGLLGPHFIEIVPGNALLPPLAPGDTLTKGISPVSFDELLHECKIIAEKVIACSSALENTLTNNEANIQKILEIGVNVEKVANAFDRDFSAIAERFDAISASVEHVSAYASEGLRSVHSVVSKIDAGTGCIGKLINEDDVYQDFRATVHSVKTYVNKMERMQFVFDTHFESMLRRAENYEYQDSKGYFDMRIHPNEHSFYLIQLATSEKGFAYRKNIERDYINLQGEPVSFRDNRVVPETLSDISSNDLFIEPPNVLIEREQQFERNTMKIGLQFGKIYHDIAFRLGLFEGTAGLGIDVDIPFDNDQFRWVTSFEMFDMRGFNRRNDKRPHVKWFNRMFVLDNIYIVFGADDFVSKRNATAFFGAGVRFGDDDVKYLFGSMATSIQ